MILFLTAPAWIQSTQSVPNWDGTYALESGPGEVAPAIEKSVTGLNAFTKVVWKKKLEGREKIYDSVSLLMGTNLTYRKGQ